MATASRSLATALWRARFAIGLLPLSYTTVRDTTLKSSNDRARRAHRGAALPLSLLG